MKKILRGLRYSGLYVIAYIVVNLMNLAPALGDDILSGVFDNIKADFGTSSDFIKILYLLEIVAAGYTYLKTKNLAVLLGIVILSLFINFALTQWVFV